MRHATRRLLKQYAVTLALAVLSALAFRTWVIEPYRIPANHPELGLLPGDYILALKPGYAWGRGPFAKGEVLLLRSDDPGGKIRLVQVTGDDARQINPDAVVGLAWRVWLSIEPQHAPKAETPHWSTRIRWRRLLTRIGA
jgi:signal peptidase I